MGYWVTGHVRATGSSVMYKSKFSIADMILRKVLIIPCEMLLRALLKNTRSIPLLGSGRGIFDGCRYSLWQLW